MPISLRRLSLGTIGFIQLGLLLVLSPRAHAGTIYTTNDATNITQLSARLNGKTAITCSQGGVIMNFEFGLTVSYGTLVPSVPAAADGNAGDVVTYADIASLTCNTTYHFRHNGTDCQTTIAGTDKTFTTLPCLAPEAPTAAVAVAGNAQATLTFTAPSDRGAPITGYAVTSIPGGGVDSNAGATSLSHGVTGLINGTSYTFTVTATNLSGTSIASAPSNAVTPAAPVDMTVPPDMTAVPDMTAPPDLAAVPDLTAPVDMTPPRDLALPADLTPPRDLNIAADMPANGFTGGGGCSVSGTGPVYGALLLIMLVGVALLMRKRFDDRS